MIRLLLAVAALALLAPAAAAQDDDAGAVPEGMNIVVGERFDDEIEDGFDAIRAGRPGDALVVFNKVIAAFEADYSSEQAYCSASFEQALIISALRPEQELQGFTILGANWCQALFGKGFALIDLGRSAESEPFLRRAVDMAPLEPHYVNELAELYKNRSQWQRSYDLFAGALELAESKFSNGTPRIRARSLRGMAYNLIELGDLDQARALYEQSLEVEPGNAGALAELAYIDELEGK